MPPLFGEQYFKKNVSTMEKSWQGAHLSTGASREAPVDNESFSTILKKSTPGISGSCFLTLGAMARSTRVNNASREALVDNRCFFNNPDDEQSWNTRLMHPYLRRHSEEHTCQQMPRARHLWTLPGFQLPSDGKSWRIGLFGELESK